jgi:hypothetical protein
VNRIKCADRLAWEWLPRTIDDLWTDPQHMPVRRRCHEMSLPVSGLCLRQLAEYDGTQEHAVAFD